MTGRSYHLNPALVGLSCFACGAEHDPSLLQGSCRHCAAPLGARYDLAALGFDPGALAGRGPSLWRFREVLPVAPERAASLGEGGTPIAQVDDAVWIKDEASNPTGSFKARGMAVAVSMARALGATALVAPSAGNAAVALAAYGEAAGLPVTVAMPADTPPAFAADCRLHGARVHLVPGTIADAGRFLAENGPPGAFNLATLREPYRLEGKKTMGYELFEQFAGRLPDAIVFPTGGGVGIIGLWKAFDEMEGLGWIGSSCPRLVVVQAAGCAPIHAALTAGMEATEAWPHPRTGALGLRVPVPPAGFLCLRALRATGGTAVAVDEPDLWRAAADLSTRTRMDVGPEAGAGWAAALELRRRGWIRPGQRVVVFNSGGGLRYRGENNRFRPGERSPNRAGENHRAGG